MEYYKILITDSNKFLWITHKRIQSGVALKYKFGIDFKGNVSHPFCDKYDKSQDLDLFQATIWLNKLQNNNIKCEIVKIEYLEV